MPTCGVEPLKESDPDVQYFVVIVSIFDVASAFRRFLTVTITGLPSIKACVGAL
jgi:hypothetical protein